MSELLSCEALTKCYQKDKTALENVDLHIGFGRIVGLLGPNGSGKTTLIKLANGLLVPDAGEIWVDGHQPGRESHAVVSYLPERNSLPLWMTVDQLQDFYADFFADFQRKRSEEMLDNLEKLDSYLSTRFKLSFGNRIIKQMYDFVPVYVACGGTELGGMDYIIARKVLKKFESMNVNFVRDEITGLIEYIEKLFGAAGMPDSVDYLRRIQNLY